MAEETLSLPFSVNSYGSITSTTDQNKIWADRVRFVIGTNLRERILDPEFGTRVPKAFMETSEEAAVLITNEVQHGFSTYLSLLRLDSVDVSYDEYTGKTNVNIVYKLPNGDVVDTAIAVTYISKNNISVQENL